MIILPCIINYGVVGLLLPEELTEALQAWIHGCHQTIFADEYTNLQSKDFKVT